jgi:hypothetical protein
LQQIRWSPHTVERFRGFSPPQTKSVIKSSRVWATRGLDNILKARGPGQMFHLSYLSTVPAYNTCNHGVVKRRNARTSGHRTLTCKWKRPDVMSDITQQRSIVSAVVHGNLSQCDGGQRRSDGLYYNIIHDFFFCVGSARRKNVFRVFYIVIQWWMENTIYNIHIKCGDDAFRTG